MSNGRTKKTFGYLIFKIDPEKTTKYLHKRIDFYGVWFSPTRALKRLKELNDIELKKGKEHQFYMRPLRVRDVSHVLGSLLRRKVDG